MPRNLGTVLAVLVLVAPGCDTSPAPGRHPAPGSDAGPDTVGPGDAGRDGGPGDAGNPGDAGTGAGGTGAFIGAGGTVRGWYGAEVTIPAGALPSPVFMRLSARVPRGTSVTLRATPCNVPTQTYDFSWTGGCAGTGTSVSVDMSSDIGCRLHLTPDLDPLKGAVPCIDRRSSSS